MIEYIYLFNLALIGLRARSLILRVILGEIKSTVIKYVLSFLGPPHRDPLGPDKVEGTTANLGYVNPSVKYEPRGFVNHIYIRALFRTNPMLQKTILIQEVAVIYSMVKSTNLTIIHTVVRMEFHET